MRKIRFVIPTALALAAALSVGAAQARDADVRWSVTIGTPVYAVPAPVYYTPPQPVYVAPVPYYRAPVHRVARYYAPSYWDRDGDGIPNRHDRVYNPAWDRDGDGIPNRHDARHTPHWDRDGDGVPNRYDRHPREGGRR